MCTHPRAGWGRRAAIAVAGMDWGGTTTPETGLAGAARRPRQKGSQQDRTPNGPPKTKPGPVARQPPAPRCLPRAARRRGVYPPQPPPQPDQRLGEVQGSPMRPGPPRMLRGARAPAGPGGGPHHPQEPRRLRRHQQPAGPLLPLQRRQARRLVAYARGRTDFRGVQASYGHREAGCVFCALECSGRMLLENEGHSLVIPRRHGADGLELHQPEWNAVVGLLKLRREQLSAQDASISGWAGLLNARGRLNSGEAAGQTVFHAHWHLIPRREGDFAEPRGGVRGVIRGCMGYGRTGVRQPDPITQHSGYPWEGRRPGAGPPPEPARHGGGISPPQEGSARQPGHYSSQAPHRSYRARMLLASA